MEDNSTPVVADSAPVNDTGTQDSENSQQAQGQDANKEQAAVQAKNLKKLKLKVDGHEVEEEIDLNDEETLKRHLQMSKAAQKRMSEAAKARREAEEIVGMFKGDLKSVLKNADKLGKTPEQLRKEVEEYFAEIIEDEMLSPEQKTIREAQRIVREREEETKRIAAEKEAKEKEELQNRYAQDYDKRISEALASSGLPKTAKTVKRMAELMYKNLDMGLDLEPQHLVQIVREDYLSEIKELFSATDGDSLLKLLGDDVANKIRKSDLARLKTPKPGVKPVELPREEKQEPQRKMSPEEWLAERRRRVMGKP